jgi:hypothetical protein
MKDWSLKDKIILNTYLYLEGQKDLKETILKQLEKLAEYYSVNTKKVAKIPTKRAFLAFLDYNKPMSERINILIYSL